MHLQILASAILHTRCRSATHELTGWHGDMQCEGDTCRRDNIMSGGIQSLTGSSQERSCQILDIKSQDQALSMSYNAFIKSILIALLHRSSISHFHYGRL